MVNKILCIGLTFFSFCASSQPFTALYNFSDVSSSTGSVDPTPTPTVTGLSFASFTAVGVSSNPSASGRFSFSKWPVGAMDGDDSYANYTAVLPPVMYYEVSISVLPSYTLQLNSITFAVRRSSTGVRTYCVRSSFDSFNDNLAASTGTNSKLSVIPTNVFFWNYDSISTSSDQKGSLVTLGNQFDSLTTTVTFRFYAWNSEASGGSFSIDNVVFSGTVMDTLTAPNPVGLKGTELTKPSVRIYPNPSPDGTVTIESDWESSVEIINELGCLMFSDHLPQSDHRRAYVLSPGMYTVKILSPTGVCMRKFCIGR